MRDQLFTSTSIEPTWLDVVKEFDGIEVDKQPEEIMTAMQDMSEKRMSPFVEDNSGENKVILVNDIDTEGFGEVVWVVNRMFDILPINMKFLNSDEWHDYSSYTLCIYVCIQHGTVRENHPYVQLTPDRMISMYERITELGITKAKMVSIINFSCRSTVNTPNLPRPEIPKNLVFRFDMTVNGEVVIPHQLLGLLFNERTLRALRLLSLTKNPILFCQHSASLFSEWMSDHTIQLTDGHRVRIALRDITVHSHIPTMYVNTLFNDNVNLFMLFQRLFPGNFDFNKTLTLTQVPKPLKLRVRPLVNTNEASVEFPQIHS
jgi:hypothetical protein